MSENGGPALGAGSIELELGDETFVMKTSLESMLALSRLGGEGGLQAMMQRCGSLNFDAVRLTVQNGLGLTSNGVKHMKLDEKIYSAGVDNVAAKAIEYLGALINGGRVREGGVDSVDPQKRAEG